MFKTILCSTCWVLHLSSVSLYGQGAIAIAYRGTAADARVTRRRVTGLPHVKRPIQILYFPSTCKLQNYHLIFISYVPREITLCFYI